MYVGYASKIIKGERIQERVDGMSAVSGILPKQARFGMLGKYEIFHSKTKLRT